MEPLAALGADQAADESVRHEVGEAVLAIEAALARVERALKAVPEDAEAWIDYFVVAGGGSGAASGKPLMTSMTESEVALTTATILWRTGTGPTDCPPSAEGPPDAASGTLTKVMTHTGCAT